jgi:RNA polymerase sigma factor (sigma-70 family)
MSQGDVAGADDRSSIRRGCADAIDELNRTRSWGLDAAGVLGYLDGLVPHVAPGSSAAALRAKAERYHLDHDLVGALADRSDLRHCAAWEDWSAQAVRIVRSRYPDARHPPAVDAHDLAQDGLVALSRALPRFHYDSRFATWAYAVVTRIAHRRVRDLRAAKRGAAVESVEQCAARGDLPAAPEDLEHTVAASLLAAAADAVLRAHVDERLALLFQLWAIDDQRVAHIGAQVRLSPSRVTALLAQVRALLQAHPALATWRDAELAG